MPKYEYKVLEAPMGVDGKTIVYSKFQTKLNGLGRQGWKVVGTGGAGSGSDGFHVRGGWAILMRKK